MDRILVKEERLLLGCLFNNYNYYYHVHRHIMQENLIRWASRRGRRRRSQGKMSCVNKCRDNNIVIVVDTHVVVVVGRRDVYSSELSSFNEGKKWEWRWKKCTYGHGVCNDRPTVRRRTLPVQFVESRGRGRTTVNLKCSTSWWLFIQYSGQRVKLYCCSRAHWSRWLIKVNLSAFSPDNVLK